LNFQGTLHAFDSDSVLPGGRSMYLLLRLNLGLVLQVILQQSCLEKRFATRHSCVGRLWLPDGLLLRGALTRMVAFKRQRLSEHRTLRWLCHGCNSCRLCDVTSESKPHFI
jgi:hypothetical protein